MLSEKKSTDRQKNDASANPSSPQSSGVSSNNDNVDSSGVSSTDNGGVSKGAAYKRTLELEAARKQLCHLDAECRAKVDEDRKNREQLITQEVNELRLAHLNEVEQAVAELEQEYKRQMDLSLAELEQQQKTECSNLGNEHSIKVDEKRTGFEETIKKRDEENEAEIVEYESKRNSELTEAIERLRVGKVALLGRRAGELSVD